MKHFLLLTILTLVFATEISHATLAEKPIDGGLGVKLNAQQPITSLGSELTNVESVVLPDNQSSLGPLLNNPIEVAPWRYLLNPSIPRLLRDFPVQTFVMIDEEDRALRIHAQFEYQGCGAELEWLVKTISQKYQVKGEMEIPAKDENSKAYRATFVGRQIDVTCGSQLIVDYADYRAISSWAQRQKQRTADAKRERAELKKRRLILDRRRAIRFADEITLGDKFRLMGAFGIPFNQPFAPKSTKNFPIDRPFIAALPNLPPEFESGEITIEISPNRNPIVIRGRFHEVDFEKLSNALAAKYGTALKSSPRHVIHKIAGNHAIIKKFDNGVVELAFIDTAAQTDQRNRRWEKESEGV